MNTSNTYHNTLPKRSNSIYAKLQSLSAFNSMYVMNHESNIIEEELTYLEAVASGDLETVKNILEDNADTDESDADISAGSNSASPTKTVENTGHGQTQTKRFKPKKDVLGTDALKPSKISSNLNKAIGIEMVEVKVENQHKKLIKPLSSHWKPNIKTATSSPLPVALTAGTSLTSLVSKKTMTHKRVFNKNCRDQWGRSGLFIAMLHHNLEMLQLLLEHKVEIEECLYHAIDFGYYNIVERFVGYDKDTTQVITGDDSFYPPGLTPIQLAAHKNDYVMLKILHSHGFRITSTLVKKRHSKKDSEASNEERISKTVLERTWDQSNNEILYYRAMASPAYMVMLFNERLESATIDDLITQYIMQLLIDKIENKDDKLDLLEEIFQLYRKLKQKASDEPTVRSLYLPLAEQVEQFACDLLSEVRSSTDLVNLLSFDPPGEPRKTSQQRYLTPVQKAIEVQMKRFVAHENSQLAISTLRLGTLFESDHGWRTNITEVLLGLMFPFLCLAFVVAPESKFGSLLRNPIVNMSCHITSDLTFLVLMVIRLLLLTEDPRSCDCLGMAPADLDYFILTWVLARVVNELKKLRKTTLIKVCTNIWQLNDLSANFLFVLVIGLKIYDIVKYGSSNSMNCRDFNSSHSSSPFPGTNLSYKDACNREKWTFETSWHIVLSEVALAVIYLLIFIRAMETLYTDRTFGPLQLSLDKMVIDTMRFLSIFLVTFVAFACTMTQLYWAYGYPTKNSKNIDGPFNKCEGDSVKNSTCHPVYSNLLDSILEQYWTLYGYGWGTEPPKATRIPRESGDDTVYTFIENFGHFTSMLFHLWAVVVMLNVLVAMLSHSFDRVRNNAELEWKFHRSKRWMKFIRKGIYPRPPPMNLIPSPRDIRSLCLLLKNRAAKCFQMTRSTQNLISKGSLRSSKSNDLQQNIDYIQAITRITTRYLRRTLLPDFRHDIYEQTAINPLESADLIRKRKPFP